MQLTDDGTEILDEHECLTLIQEVRIGRVAVCRDDVAAVMPVAFVLIGREIFFFTGTGTKWDAALRRQSITFEVDEIDAATESGWSVMLVGRAERATATAVARAEALGLYPWASGERHHLVRLRAERVTGRRLLK